MSPPFGRDGRTCPWVENCRTHENKRVHGHAAAATGEVSCPPGTPSNSQSSLDRAFTSRQMSRAFFRTPASYSQTTPWPALKKKTGPLFPRGVGGSESGKAQNQKKTTGRRGCGRSKHFIEGGRVILLLASAKTASHQGEKRQPPRRRLICWGDCRKTSAAGLPSRAPGSNGPLGVNFQVV